MRALANGAASAATSAATSETDAADPTQTVIDAVAKALADLNDYSVSDTLDDVELAELIGKLRGVVGVLVSILNR